MKISLNLSDMLLGLGGAILVGVVVLFIISIVMSKGSMLVTFQIMLTLVKKYWSIVLIFIVGVTVLLMKRMLESKAQDVADNVKKTDVDMDKIKTKVSNVNKEAEVEIAVVKSKDTETKKRLKEIKKIDDDYEKAKALSDLL